MEELSIPENEGLVQIKAGQVWLEGNLHIPRQAHGVVLFAHGSGSSRHSPRNRYVAGELRTAGLASLLVDLLTADEERGDMVTLEYRFNIGLLAERLVEITHWLRQEARTRDLKLGYFGASTGAGAALVAAANLPGEVGAIVSRGGRPDLAGPALDKVTAPTLLIVGEMDPQVHFLNREALAALAAPVKELAVIPGATHLFEEPGTLEAVARLASDWFDKHLGQTPGAPS